MDTRFPRAGPVNCAPVAAIEGRSGRSVRALGDAAAHGSRSAVHRVDRRSSWRDTHDVVAVRPAMGRRTAVPLTRLGGDLLRRQPARRRGSDRRRLLVLGGVLSNVGAILYGLRWPNPWPHSFGYHEFFHAFAAAAAVSHYVAVWSIVRQIQRRSVSSPCM